LPGQRNPVVADNSLNNQMNSVLLLSLLLLCLVVLIINPSVGAPALLLCLSIGAVVALIISRSNNNREFLLRLFLAALLLRMLVGLLIYTFNLQEFFGGDALSYDGFGYSMLKAWQGDAYYKAVLKDYIGRSNAAGWGMLYLVAVIYGIVGRNMLAIQFVNAILGAATAPIIFLIAQHVFDNSKVARISAQFTAFYPSLILWSAQGLKDGPIVFLLTLSILATLKLGDRLSFKYLVVLICSMFALLSLRFYIFYMMAAAVAGAFVIGMRQVTMRNFLRQWIVIIAVGLGLTYFGVSRFAVSQYETFGNLSMVQSGRKDLAQRATSGYSSDSDVSSTSGALTAIPAGMLYLLFAPFPWQLASLRQSITMPEMLVWWVSFPLLMLGLWFAIKYRLRRISPILIFTTMLTLAYSIGLGNIGTAYRQRSQLLVFYFIFVAVGYVLFKESRDEMKRKAKLVEKGS
jgi:hypothetical protein